MLKGKKGFTLIELLIVIVIIGILAGIIIGIVGTSATNKAKDASNKANIHEIQTALETYFTDNNAYPATLAALQTSNPPYLDTTMTLTPYTYTPANNDTTYTLSFVLLNQGDNGTDVSGTAPNKIYVVTQKQ
jgi:type II secretion system protein G